MPKKIYEKAETADVTLLNSVMALYHHELTDAELRVAFVMCRKFDAEDNPIPSLKFAGGHAAAITRKVSARRKAHDPHDVEIEADGMRWTDMSTAQKTALLDHELSHIRLKTDRHGIVQQDENGRVKVGLVPDDIVLTAFLEIIRRHGDAALEWTSITAAHTAASEVHAVYEESSDTEAEEVNDAAPPDDEPRPTRRRPMRAVVPPA